MINARERRELEQIAACLERSDPVLARRLARHRLRWCGVGARHRWLRAVVFTAAVVVTAGAGLGLLTAAIAGGCGPVCLALGIVLLTLVPFTPVLVEWRRGRTRHISRHVRSRS